MARKTKGPAKPFEVENPAILTDADWAILNELVQKHRPGTQAFQRALTEIGLKRPESFMRLLAAINPDKFRDAALDANAALGLDDDDIRELIREIESPSKKSH